MKENDLTTPVLGMAKYAISLFLGAFFQVALESNLRPHGPYMGLVNIPKGHEASKAGLRGHWCILLDK